MILATMLCICSCKPQKKRYTAEFLNLFDTVTQIVGYSEYKEEFSELSQFIHDELEIYHKLYDIYNDYEGINNIKTINDNAGIAPVKVDKKIIDMLLLAKDMYLKTKGKMNVALGSVLKIWHDYRIFGIDNPEQAKLPPYDELEKAAEHTDINDVVIDEKAMTVYLKDPLMSLDVGGIGKGFATEQVCLAAESAGYVNCIVSVGGNVRAIGHNDYNNSPWNVGIQNPDIESEEQNILYVNLEDASLVTSGNYQRYYTVDSKRYNHIIDPDTLMPSEYFSAVTIICPDSGIADCLSTAVFNISADEGLEFIESLENTEAVWVLPNGKTVFSSGFENYLRESYKN